jgi:hypothetical protein
LQCATDDALVNALENRFRRDAPSVRAEAVGEMPLIGRQCAVVSAACLRALLALFGLLALPDVAHAQAPAEESRWLVMPSVVATQGDPKHPARAAARLISEDMRAHGKRAFSIEQAKELFEQHGSTPPMTASAADIDELAKDAQRALYHVASGLPQRAKKDVERALDRARRALESLNRETRAAQHLLDACLYLVRAHLQHGDRAQARMKRSSAGAWCPISRPSRLCIRPT